MRDLKEMKLDPEFEYLRASSKPYKMPCRPGEVERTYAKVGETPLHRIVLGLEGIPARTIMGDHINGDTLDNRRENLRLATASQNAMNRRPRSDNKSGVRGVCWDKRYQKWEAYVKVDGKQKKIGRFVSIEQAAEAVAQARAEMHGRFARHD